MPFKEKAEKQVRAKDSGSRQTHNIVTTLGFVDYRNNSDEEQKKDSQVQPEHLGLKKTKAEYRWPRALRWVSGGPLVGPILVEEY